MDKILVVVFDSEPKAYEGSKALQELQNEGSINLYAKAVIARDASGKVTVKQQGDMGPVGTAVGLLTGSLIGLIGGPVGARRRRWRRDVWGLAVRPGDTSGSARIFWTKSKNPCCRARQPSWPKFGRSGLCRSMSAWKRWAASSSAASRR